MTSWHTRYRPHQIKDLHLNSVRDQLTSLMEAGKLPQVFLFAGPKGTGKTSTSRILGAMVNDPANEEVVDSIFFGQKSKKSLSFKEPDDSLPVLESIFSGRSFLVQEMDAASNRGIDDIRALKERVSLPPQEGKVAVYILDEAHMLTTEAFNALLKLLEEPPPHTMFILATTELHKIPETVASRCSLVRFHKASHDEIMVALKNILKSEKIKYEDEALTQIAAFADGSFRDAVKVLEQLASGGDKVTLKLVEKQITSAQKEIVDLIDAVLNRNEEKVSQIFSQVRNSGTNTAFFHKNLLEFIHNDLLIALGVKDGRNKYDKKISHFLLSQLMSVEDTTSVIPLLPLELKLLELVFRSQQKKNGSGGAKLKTTPPKEDDTEDIEEEEVGSAHSVEASNGEVEVPAKTDLEANFKSDNLVEPQHVDSSKIIETWDAFVTAVSVKNATVAALLRSAKPLKKESNGSAKVEVFYDFHREQLQQPKFLQILHECAQDLVGIVPNFEFVVADKKSRPDVIQRVDFSHPQAESQAESKDEQSLEEMADDVLL